MGVGLSALSLAACVALPIDPRTGQPLPWPVANTTREVTVITPAAPSAPAAASTYTARLYPVNEAANRAGMLTALVVESQDGRGRIMIQYKGEAMQGEATRVDANNPGFGRIHQQVLGMWPRQSQGRRGIANAYGGRGISAQCEYVLTGPSQGTGVCVFSDDAHYQIHFG